MPVIHFRDDDAGYAAWLSAHPGGFVFNHFRTSNSSFNVIHRASCSFLHRPRDEGRRTRIEKVCSEDLDFLVVVVDALRAHAGGWKWCGSCLSHKATGPSDAAKRVQASGLAVAVPPIHMLPVQSVPAPASSSRPPVRAEDFTLWRPKTTLACLENIEPRLASWDAKTQPSQVRLATYLDEVHAAFERHLLDPQRPLYFDIEVVRPPHMDLLRHYDIENYLFPIVARLRTPAVVLAKGVKRYPQHSSDHSRITLGEAEPGAQFAGCGFLGVSVEGSPGSTTWKHAIRRELIEAGVERAGEGPLAMVIALRSGRPLRSWWNAWKAIGDALGPILGEPIPENPFNPSDDRIVSLEMHHTPSPGLKDTTQLGIWWQVVE